MKSRKTIRRKISSGAEVLTRPTIPMLEGARAFAALRSQVEAAGILKRDYLYYALMSVFVTGGLLVSVYAFAVSQAPFLLVFLAVCIAIFVVQFGGLMHDAGHRTIFSSTFWNDVVGQYYGAMAVLSFDQWKWTHNKHHARPNEEDEDPDIGIIFHAFTKRQVPKNASRLMQFLFRHQAYLFYPLRSFTFASTRIDSFAYFRSHFPKAGIQFFFFLLGMALWFVAPFLVFPLWKALFFLIVVNFTGGFYASNIFAPNHKGMPHIGKGVRFSFLEQQIVTARNVAPGFFTDFLYMGLNYQIEHHLFPTCPRNKLKLLVPYAKDVCRRNRLDYTVASVVDTHRDILSKLAFVGRSA